MQAHHMQVIPRGHGRGHAVCLRGSHAELVGAKARGNVGMAARVHVRVDPQCDPGTSAMRRGDGVDAFHFTGRFGVDGLEAHRDGPHQLIVCFAHAGKHNLVRRKSGTQGDVNLAAGIGVGMGALTPNLAHHGQRGVGLDGVVEVVRVRRKRRVQFPDARAEQRPAVHVQRRTGCLGYGRERHVIAHQCAVAAVESRHRASDCSPPHCR